MLICLTASHREIFEEALPQRRLLTEALAASRSALRRELQNEQVQEQELDEAYWRPLKQELEALRRAARKKK